MREIKFKYINHNRNWYIDFIELIKKNLTKKIAMNRNLLDEGFILFEFGFTNFYEYSELCFLVDIDKSLPDDEFVSTILSKAIDDFDDSLEEKYGDFVLNSIIVKMAISDEEILKKK